jgi:hypothetical protein
MLTHPAGRLGSPIKRIYDRTTAKKKSRNNSLRRKSYRRRRIDVVCHGLPFIPGREFFKVKPQPV